MNNPLHSLPSLGHQPTARASDIARRAAETAERSGKASLLMLTGASAGAALMYIFDPQQGRRRRAISRDKLARGSHLVSERTQATLKDVCQRGYGLYAEGRRRLSKQPLSDDILHARVRAKLGRYTHYAHAIDASVKEGTVTLRGPALTQDAERLIAQIARLRGVQAIDNQLELHDDAANIAALQGARDISERTSRWTPTQRAAASAAGTSLLVGGLLRRGSIGFTLGALGAGLLAAGALTGARRGQRAKQKE